MGNRNPFRVVVDEAGERSQAGLSWEPFPFEFAPSEIRTFVGVGDRTGDTWDLVAQLPPGVLWEPVVGSIVELGEPNRDATVYRLVYRIGPGELSCRVYVADSMAEGDVRRPATRGTLSN